MNIGIVGCGAATSSFYAPALALLENEGLLRVSALYDPDPAAMDPAARMFPDARWVGELTELLRHEVDLVIVASPPRYHAEQAILALRSGRSVLCERPPAMSAADGKKLIEAATEAGGVLAVSTVHRLFPATRAIRKFLGNRTLGDLQWVQGFEGGPSGGPGRKPSHYDPFESGGVFRDIGSHVLDLLTWWFGSPEAVGYEDDAMGGVEANCRLRLTYDSFDCTVRLSRDWARPNRYFFQGSRGWLSWTANEADRLELGFHDSEHPTELRLHQATTGAGTTSAGEMASHYHQSFVEQIRSVVSAVRGEDAVFVSGEEAIENVRLMEQCYHQRTLIAMPWLDEREQQAARQLSGSAA